MKLKLPARYYTTIGKLEFPGNFPSKDAIPDRKMWKTYIEFDHHQRINYRNIYVKCPCGKDDSYLISTVCREGWEYPVVICHNCGLIRAKYYWDEKGVIDFYSNWFHKKYGVSVLSEVEISPDKFFEIQKTKGKDIKSFVNEHTSKLNRPYTVVDIGGGSGGSLYSFIEEANCFLFDYSQPLLNYAKTMNIHTALGGIDKLADINEKPDLVILSDVLEHFVDLNKEITKLKKYMPIGSLLYIKAPGVDSINMGRQKYDFLDEIHRPHVYYFSLDVLNNLMSRHGFKCLKATKTIIGLYEYTGEIGELVNYHDKVCSIIRKSEIKRKMKLWFFRQLIGKILYTPFKHWLRDHILNLNYMKSSIREP